LVRLPNRAVESEIDDEIAFHLESRIRELVAEGHGESDARRLADAEFGDVNASRRELAAVDRHRRRRERITHVVETIVQDLRHAAKSLGRTPAFTITAMITLVVGIGSAVAIFAVVDDVLLRPLPFASPDRLVGAWTDFPPLGMTHSQQAAITYWTYQSQARTIEGIGIYDVNAVNVAADGGAPSAPRHVSTALFTATMFQVLGVSATRGRVFNDAEDQPGAPPVMLISEGMWRAQFGGDPAIVGRSLEVNGVRREIIGVMPANFRFPLAETEIWIPLGLDPNHPPANAFAYYSVARLKTGESAADAQRDFADVLPRVATLFPTFVTGLTTRQMLDQVKPKPVITPLRDDITGGIARTLWMMAAAAALLLLVACVNVANLTLVRFDARQRELAVREAIGASRARVMQAFFSESAVLAATAGLFGVIVAWVLVRALVAGGPADIPRLGEITIDARALSVAMLITVLAAVLCSLIPMLRIRIGPVALRGGARSVTATRRQHRVRAALVASQIAIALVVLSGSGLLVRTFLSLHAIRPGFDADHVATLWISLPRVQYKQNAEIGRFYSTLINRVAQLPNVNSVGVTSRLPLVLRGINPNPLYPEDDPSYATKLPPLQMFTTIGGNYFRTMGIPLIAGRVFDRMETQRDGDAIISRRAAQIFWKDSTGVAALGKRFRALPTEPLSTVVGVVGDVRDTMLAAPPSPTIYFPELAQPAAATSHTVRTMALAIRTTADPTAVISAAQRIVREIDPSLPTFDVQLMTRALRTSTAQLGFTILILGGAAMVTVLLGAVGLYGMLAYVVTLRRREFGIRITLGATPRAVAVATTRVGLVLTSAGVAAGLVLFAAVARFIRGFLFGVAPWDPPTILSAALGLLAVAALASWIPARRAARVDPAEALRAE
jgi:predicted permease